MGRSAKIYGGKSVRKMRPLLTRFFAKVRVHAATSCWPWISAKDKAGYGYFNMRNATCCRNIRAHRLSWILHNAQDIPKGLFVLHRCDNPSCVNPRHLFLGTNTDNMRDMADKKRACLGEKHPAAKITAKDALSIRIDKRSCRKIATEYGIGHNQVSRIKKGERWGNLEAVK